MKRLYYLTDSLEFAQQVARQLFRVPGFLPEHLHVVGSAGRCQVHDRSPTMARDLWRAAEWGFGLGGGLAAFAVLASFAVGRGNPGGGLSWVAVGALLGALIAVLQAGFRENRRCRGFHDVLCSGKVLLVVDVRPALDGPVRALLAHIPITPVSVAADAPRHVSVH